MPQLAQGQRDLWRPTWASWPIKSDPQTYWRLRTTAPTWTQDTTGGIIVKGTMTCTVTEHFHRRDA